MENNLAFLMFDSSRAFRREVDTLTRDLGVTSHQWRLVGIVVRNPGINQCDAADMLDVEPITLSRMVDKLEQAGMMERRPAPADRRAWCLHVTETARPITERIRAIVDQVLDQCLNGFSDEEIDQFTQYVERYRANLNGKAASHGRHAEIQRA